MRPRPADLSGWYEALYRLIAARNRVIGHSLPWFLIGLAIARIHRQMDRWDREPLALWLVPGVGR